eukprot:CAMPEP_0197629550 /NCGR_PEP_ID=MMETSP1338-20131121/7350_1 /TAXON_ID=43686 ORGANISM="Pelagodinium beii, Strain RCC1491" /NCGR_SAMPLE_ID=MMETSP1338 /ASSEMBLY_ACC=CAM_ASM_000754 /LENGTH=836 /DNA_ID=CAMNT_0043200607 /DNA_START=40 /DNA_END=2550 /DNA_ORIENTATION=-
MGSQCSASLGQPADDVLRFAGCAPQSSPCDNCDDDSKGNEATFETEHPLLQQMKQEQQEGASSSTPRTPRGPAPPWAVQTSEREVDRTATGATPPRCPTPPRATPPGLPEEDVKSAASVLTLTTSLGSAFQEDLFKAVRSGDTNLIQMLIQRVNTAAASLVSGTSISFRTTGAGADDRNEKTAELVAAFLTKVRDSARQNKDTLLGAAAFEGQIQILQLLLSHKVDPLTTDEKGNTALHKAGEGGQLLATLVLLDRMQSNDRSLSVTTLQNADGETPEMSAALSGAGEICRALEVFGDMQNDAEMKQLGSNPPAAADMSGPARAGLGDALAVIDLAQPAAASTAALLRRSAVGTKLVPNLFERIPDDQAALEKMVDRVCTGIQTAEDLLRETTWNASDPGIDPALRSFVATAELRSNWQRIREEALRSQASEGIEASLEDFWQTSLTADAMVQTIRQAMGDTFQLLLTALWLYTREAWLRHVLDGLATALHAASSPGPEGATGATGCTPSSQELPHAFQVMAPFVEALAPCMQLVQGALAWFEEANIRHTAATYRPLLLPMLGLQKLVDRYVAQRRSTEAQDDKESQSGLKLDSGSWISLGAGSFFSSLSSRPMAIRRLSRTRCNALLIIRPDENQPCYPKHMSLRGSSVDDTLFPLETVFRIGRITRTVSSDLDTEGVSVRGPNSRWPVMIIEVWAANRYTEAMEILQKRDQLDNGELLKKLEEWIAAAPADQEADRLYQAGDILAKAKAQSETELKSYLSQAWEFLTQAASAAEATGRIELASQVLLSKAKMTDKANKEKYCQQAYTLVKVKFGSEGPQTERVKTAAREMGVNV